MSWEIKQGDWIDVLRTMPDESVHCVVTSPPYFGLRNYGVEGQLGLEPTMGEYLEKMVLGFREVARVLRNDGNVWLNLGDSYNAAGRTGHGTRFGFKQGTNRASAERKDWCRPSSSNLKPKDLLGIPWRVAFALQDDGWYLRQDIVWAKPNPMPESVTDRCTKSHEYIFLLSKSEKYYFNQEAILEPCSPNTHARLSQDVEAQIGSERANGGQKTNGNMKAVGRTSWNGSSFDNGKTGEMKETRGNRRPKAWDVDMGSNRTLAAGYGRKLAESGSGIKSNESFATATACLVEKRNRRSVWEVTTQPFSEAHFATFPPKLVEPCILAGCPQDGTVLDPFNGAGTTGLVATRLGRNYIGIELSPSYCEMARRRIEGDAPLFNSTSSEPLSQPPSQRLLATLPLNGIYDTTLSSSQEHESENSDAE